MKNVREDIKYSVYNRFVDVTIVLNFKNKLLQK